jgi:toxic protein SymE
MKVYEMSGFQYKPTPTIVLKGQWLSQFGFKAGDNIDVRCEEGKLTVTKVADSESEEN